MKKRILIVDDHPLVIEGIKTLLLQHKNVTVAGSAVNASEALKILKETAVDIIFLDVNLPDINGIELCKLIKADYPAVHCLALSTFNDRSYVSKMIENGASGYLLKNSTREELFEAIDQIDGGSIYLHLELQPKTYSRFDAKPVLTRREKEVLFEIAEGLTNQQIAEKLCISITTVSSHRQNLMLKLEANNTAVLIKTAAKHNLI